MNSSSHLSGEISAMELHHWLDSGKPLMLLDVMDEECFTESHIPGAVRACVYETSFIDQVRALNADQGASIVIYGTGSQNLASSTACTKLRDVGYTHLYDMRGGLNEWASNGYPTEGKGSASEPDALLNGNFTLAKEKSVVRWTGRNLLNHHEGTIPFSSGQIVVENGNLISAEFKVDMRAITCADLTDATWNAMLIHHLMDADFFDVGQWPEASFVSTKAEAIANAKPGSANYQITGNFTLRGQTHPITFSAVVGSDDNQTLAGQAEFDLDRTQWGALYGSGKFFERLGKHLVNDLVHLHLKIIAEKSA